MKTPSIWQLMKRHNLYIVQYSDGGWYAGNWDKDMCEFCPNKTGCNADSPLKAVMDVIEKDAKE